MIGRMSRARVGLAITGLILLSLALRFAFFTGYAGLDDAYYIEAAYRVSVADIAAFDSHFAVRSGLVMPTAAAYALFGVSALTSVLLPLACSIGATIVAFAFGRYLFDDRTGLLAALLLAFVPLDAIFSSELFACVPSELFAGLAAFLLIRDHDDTRPWPAFAAGACLGIAAVMGDTALFCLLPVSYYFAFVAPRRWRAAWCLAGLAGVIAIESTMYYALTGDALLRWRTLSRAVATQGNLDVLSGGLGWSYVAQPFVRLLTEQEFGLFPAFVAAALWYHIVRRGSAPRAWSLHLWLGVWVVTVFLYTSYGTTSLSRFAPLPRLPRYLAPAVLPAIVLLAAFLMQWRPWRRHVAVALLCTTSLLCVWLDNGRHVKDSRRTLHAFVLAQPAQHFVLDGPLMFDELVFRGFRTDSRLSVLVEDDNEQAAIERKRSVYGTTPVVHDLTALKNTFVAVTRPSLLDRARAMPNAERVISFTPPDRLYYRLLRSPRVVRILGLIRDPYRVQGLQAVSSERIDVYRVR